MLGAKTLSRLMHFRVTVREHNPKRVMPGCSEIVSDYFRNM